MDPAVYLLNPFALLITGYRHAIFYGTMMAPRDWAILTLESLICFAIGVKIYQYFDRRVIKFL